MENPAESPVQRPKKTGKQKAILISRIALAVLAVLVYAKYFIDHPKYELQDWLVSGATLIIFTMAMIVALPKLIDALSGESDTLLVKPKNSAAIFFAVMLGALVLHIGMTLLGMFIYTKVGGAAAENAAKQGFMKLWQTAWMKSNTDAKHYINIAENWYVNTEPDNLLIVFFPMLPVMIRFMNLITHNSFISAQLINTVATCLASGMTYLTLTPVIGDKRARWGAIAAILMPGMIFMNSPMSEPLFMLFTVCCFFFIQKRQLVIAGVFAALAGFTRSLGVLLAVPIAIEGVCYIVRLAKNKKNWQQQIFVLLLALIVSTLGTIGYLYINKRVSGEWLRFLVYQKDNWYQSACPFFETVRYIVRYLQMAFTKHDSGMIMLWITSLITIFGSLILMAKQSRRLPATYTFHYFAYFIVATGCTWLLSSVRYMSALLPLVAAISLGFDKKWKTAIIFTLLVACYIAYMTFYMLRWSVY
ncbi:MAG: glycosyltransferase family 39 protein [Clostridia bacterium]|nr:glycosyltransferase family 39 protein [Clostridia bacterium]